MPPAWELLAQPDEKLLAICVPHTGEVTSEWAMKFRTLQVPPGTQIFMSRGMPIDVTRETMINEVLKFGYQWVFFLDSDIILPDGAIDKLFSHNFPFINGLYKAKKPNGFFWGAWMEVETPEGAKAFAPIDKWDGRVIEVNVIGCGCMLVHRSVFEKIKEMYPKLPLFFWSKDRNPEVLDAMGIPDPIMREVSEDFWFCLLAKKCGFPVLVDTEVKCKHLALTAIDENMVGLPGV